MSIELVVSRVVAILLLVALAPAGVAAAPQESGVAAAAPAACDTEEHRKAAFWVGDWQVFDPQGQRVGRNRVEMVLGGCALHESWTSERGSTGHSYTFYDAAADKWHQTWIDSQGQALYLDGGWEGESLVLSDAANRISWTPLQGGRVRQLWETTSDGGATWSTVFDGEYRPDRS